MRFSLVIPCFNEEENLPGLIDRCLELINSLDCEVIIVNNGSTDNSAKTLSRLIEPNINLRAINIEENIGYGHGILTGLRDAKGEILGWTHADLQTDPLDCIDALSHFDRNNELFVKGKRGGRSLFDTFFTVCMSIFESILLKTLMWDINGQPTLFRKEFFASWEDPPEDFSLDLYGYYMAKLQKVKIKRISVYFGKRFSGVSSWNSGLKSRVKFIKRTISYSFKIKKDNL